MISLQLFSTSGCHLCELAKQLLDEVAIRIPLACEEIEIADSEHLVELYGVRIPVLRDEVSGRELGWPFDQARLELFLKDS
jgi:hypothetical protein